MRSRAIRNALKVMRATGLLVKGDAGLMRGVEFHLVADRGRRTASIAEDRHKNGQECRQEERARLASPLFQHGLLRVDASRLSVVDKVICGDYKNCQTICNIDKSPQRRRVWSGVEWMVRW